MLFLFALQIPAPVALLAHAEGVGVASAQDQEVAVVGVITGLNGAARVVLDLVAGKAPVDAKGELLAGALVAPVHLKIFGDVEPDATDGFGQESRRHHGSLSSAIRTGMGVARRPAT